MFLPSKSPTVRNGRIKIIFGRKKNWFWNWMAFYGFCKSSFWNDTLMVSYWIAIHCKVYVDWQMAYFFKCFMHLHNHISFLWFQLASRLYYYDLYDRTARSWECTFRMEWTNAWYSSREFFPRSPDGSRIIRSPLFRVFSLCLNSEK